MSAQYLRTFLITKGIVQHHSLLHKINKILSLKLHEVKLIGVSRARFSSTFSKIVFSNTIFWQTFHFYLLPRFPPMMTKSQLFELLQTRLQMVKVTDLWCACEMLFGASSPVSVSVSVPASIPIMIIPLPASTLLPEPVSSSITVKIITFISFSVSFSISVFA